MTKQRTQPLDDAPEGTCFACECCAYLVHESRPTGSTWQVCPICAWSDASEWSDNWNSVSLLEARRNFDRLAACEPHFLEIVRAVQPIDKRNPLVPHSRESLSSLRAEILRVFGDVKRCNGTSLQEAEWNDDYCYGKSSREVDAVDPEVVWFHVSDEKLDRYAWGNFCFMNVWGLRFYTPRYLLRYVDVLLEEKDSIDALETLLWALVRNANELVPLYTKPQVDLLLKVVRTIAWWEPAASGDAWALLDAWSPLRSNAGSLLLSAERPTRRS